MWPYDNVLVIDMYVNDMRNFQVIPLKEEHPSTTPFPDAWIIYVMAAATAAILDHKNAASY